MSSINKFIENIWIICLLLWAMFFCFAEDALADYQLTRYPLDETAKVTANYGQYRNYGPSYRVHDGIDLAGGIDGKLIYPVAEGIIKEVKADKPREGFGVYIIVEHDRAVPTHKTMYAHLQEKRIVNNDTGEFYKVNDRVSPNKPIGYVGNTGNSKGSHLHFNIGIQVLGGGQENPLVAGLPQPYADENNSRIVSNKAAIYQSNEYIRIIGPGKDGVFDEDGDFWENEEVNFPEPDNTYKIVVEAYQSPDDKYNTNPYGVEFVVEKLWPRDSSEEKHEYRRFNKTFSDMNNNYRDYYSFVKPCITYPESHKDFYYLDWTPKSYGIYNIKVKVYSAYRQGGQLRFQDPPDIQERIVTVGMAGVDFNEGAYAKYFNPNDPRVSLAGVTARVSLVDDYPIIFFNDISNRCFSINPDDRNFPNSTFISARADKNVDWKVKILNDSNTEIATLTDSGQKFYKQWSGNADGVYTYQIEASDPVTGKKTTDYGVATIQIDNQKPDFFLKSNSTVYITTGEASATLEFSSDEDLYAVRVDVVDVTGSPVIEYLATCPNLNRDEPLSVEWGNAGTYPNGWYYFNVILTDFAGNQKVENIPIQVNLPGETAPSENPPGNPFERLIPPDKVKNLSVGDIAFDNNGNIYVAYTNKLKVVKYNNIGQEVGGIESFNDTSLWYPMGITVSSSGDRVYVADTYNQRILIYDGNLNPVSEIRENVYGIQGVLKYYYYWPVLICVREVRGGRPKEFWPAYMSEGEKYSLPTDVFVLDNVIYVTDKDGHRIVKHESDGSPSYFDEIKLDLKDTAKQAEEWARYGYDIITKTLEFIFIDLASAFVSGRYEVIDFYFKSNQLHDLMIPNYETPGFASGEPSLFPSHAYHRIPSPGSSEIEGRLSSPSAATIDASGSIYVSDTGNNRVQVFNPDGSFKAKFGEGILNSPKGIDIDSHGSVWVAELIAREQNLKHN